jgi:hypothetical protein
MPTAINDAAAIFPYEINLPLRPAPTRPRFTTAIMAFQQTKTVQNAAFMPLSCVQRAAGETINLVFSPAGAYEAAG